MFMIGFVCVGYATLKNKTDDWIDPQLMDSHQQRKHRRIMAIAKVIERRGRVNYKQFLAEMQYHGLRKSVAEEYLEALKDLGKVKFDKGDIVWDGKDEGSKIKKKKTLTRMKTRKQIEEELETLNERIKQTRIFRSEDEIDYEEGYINCLEWVLKNLEELKIDRSKFAWKRISDSPHSMKWDRGCRDAFEWAMNP